jgi:alpha-amylase
MHYSGCLLEWIEKRHPEFFEQLRELVKRKQVEIVGGGHFEPILISIPPEDRVEQIHRLADYVEQHLGTRPRGIWLTERVWEPQLPSSLAAAGVEYTLVDDAHFFMSGFEAEQLHGTYVAEDLGACVRLIPGLKALRYMIPFHDVDENISFLREAARQTPGGCAAIGDDNEKFGVWPGTYEHCYRDGWLERFFTALAANSDWLSVTPPGEYLAANPPLGRADLPTASYIEMMGWALPTAGREKYHRIAGEFVSRPEVTAFLRGGFWRVFFSKYCEANLLHKKMLHVAGKVRELSHNSRRGLPFRRAARDARTHLLRAQCNDAYWHGVFGGLYSPHLRTELWRELIRAEKIADAAANGHAQYSEIARLDFDCDGHEEIYICSDAHAALIKPSDGGTIPLLDFRPADVTLVNSLERRREASHAQLAEAEAGRGVGLASIHSRLSTKEENLSRYLRYDRWPRHAFRLLLFPPWKNFEDYTQVHLEESEPFAAGAYRVDSASPEAVKLTLESSLVASLENSGKGPIRVEKSYSFAKAGSSLEVTCGVSLSHQLAEPLHLQAGIEMVLNFLAPDAHDRYFESAGQRQPLRWSAATPASQLRVVDEWQNVAAVIEASAAREFWVAPIDTISISEDGFERVYQGSQILAVWPLEVAPGATWSARLSLRVTTAR